jgi:hypothetical protein
MSEIPAESVQAFLQAGFELPADRKFYFNGILTATSPVDVIFVLLQNNQPVALLNTTREVAKTLAGNIQAQMDQFETQTDQHILTTDELNAALSKEK